MLEADRADRRRCAMVSRAIAGVVAVVFMLSGCDDDEGKRQREAVQQAQETLELQVAVAKVVEDAYADGRLGPVEKVRADIDRYVQEAIGFGAQDPEFVTPEGRLVPFADQTEGQRAAFLSWVNGPEVFAAVGPEIGAARDEARMKWEQE